MFKKTAVSLASLIPTILAFQETESPYLGSTVTTPQSLDIMDEIGTTPCIFKLGDSFYDYTPIKLAYPDPIVPFFSRTDILQPEIKYEFVFGWCQQIREIKE